ncbi:CarboxypepD_reg-like domain-containing protein [Mucilaginibacter mallensis]|uniref:CarboxypepD_reg-like domain-containing protein n=1 Tax=Mucilaginibacter mallensis TaxID=652787 RepID=A0A1H2CDF7_MUCMA|nr:carboxypeptidase-like regulatory domain-containing protein [Mucilaginibacter mallensis]SDT68364.1 CarboxypepD_reg-like domain-containing protein [Mucilaginibacter mallensis]
MINPHLKNGVKRSLLFLIPIVLMAFNVSAQSVNTVIGKVISDDRGEGIEEATITWKNKGINSVTNTDGEFRIVLPDSYNQSDSLTFSCIGYYSKNIDIHSALIKKYNTIRLNTSVENLKEVVVKPLTLKQLLDSVINHNNKIFVSPMDLHAYYRESAYVNLRCTEYSDALCEYYASTDSLNKKPVGQLKINASRCIMEKKDNKDRHNAEIDLPSNIDANVAFNYAFLSETIKKYFPEKNFIYYKYDLEQSGQNADDIRVTIYPKQHTIDEIYKLTLYLNNDFVLRSYHFEIPDDFLNMVKEKSLLGIHVKCTKLDIKVNYLPFNSGIYPNHFVIIKSDTIRGKMLGTTFNEAEINKSEFVVTQINKGNNLKPFRKNEIYKKGNICANGMAMSDSLLKKYTIIIPSSKDSLAIKSMESK